MMTEFSSSPEPAEDEVEPFSLEEEDLPTNSTKKSKNKSRNKRRFSDEQVRSLETIFQSETKIDPRKKMQVARDLGLQPRQVAIWFQNKRARWKSKEIEKNHRVLKANYDTLKTQFENTTKEKESLLSQLQELQNQLEKLYRGNGSEAYVGDGANKSEQSRGKIQEFAAGQSMVGEELGCQGAIHSHDDHKSGHIAYLGQQEETHLLIIENHTQISSAPQAKWCGFDSGNLFDQSSTSSHWWDSWT